MSGEAKQIYAGSPFPLTVVSIAANMATAYVAGNVVGGSVVIMDNSTMQYPYAVATLDIKGTFAVAPTANSIISLWAVPQDIDGTTDSTAGSTVVATPAAESGFTSTGGARLVGAFPLANSASAQYVRIPISLKGTQKASFFIKNESGQTINAGTGTEITVAIIPFTIGPA